MKRYLTLILLVVGLGALHAQDTTKQEPPKKPDNYATVNEKHKVFRGELIVGLNASQVDGDRQAGFNKAGANAGVGALIMLPKNFSVGIELLYSMKGARGSNDDWKANGYHRSITLDYIDLAALINYRWKPYLMFSVGAIPNILVRQDDEVLEPTLYGVQGFPYRRFGVDGTLGVTGILKDHYALNLRWQYSLARINDLPYSASNAYANYYDGQMRHNIISVRFLYIF